MFGHGGQSLGTSLDVMGLDLILAYLAMLIEK